VRLDADEAAENASGAIVESVFVKEIAGGMRRGVVLERAGIEFLNSISDGDGEQIAPCAFTRETAKAFKTRIAAAEMQIQTFNRRFVLYFGGIDLQGENVIPPILRAHVSDFGARTRNQVVHSASEAGRWPIYGVEMLDYCNFGKFVGDEEQVWKHGGIFASQPMKNFNRQFDFNATRNVKKCS